MNIILQDLRFALRQMLRSPGFAITAVLILALGIGANVIVFGVLQALVLRPLDVPHADRVMSLEREQNGNNFSFPEVRDIRDGNSAFSAVAGERVMDVGLEANGVSRSVWGYEVSGQYFEVLPIKPLLGRLLQRADDDHPGAAEVAVLTWPAWKNYFNSDANVVGKTVRVDKHPYTIVGVTPQGFLGTEKFIQPDIFVPMANQAQLEGFDWLESRGNEGLWAVVRVKDGVTLPQVQADLNVIASRMAATHPKEDERLSLKAVKPGLVGDTFGAPARTFFAGIMALAGIVLLAACANLGSLFAARTAHRAREIAIRMAIGSSRWRIVRQIVTEAFVIAVLGGSCACALAWTVLTGLSAWHPSTQLPIQFAVLPQPSLILISLFVSALAGALFGVMPLRQILKADPNDAIKSGSSQAYAGKRWALRDVLLAAQIALCCITVTAAFVALRGLGRSLTTQMGFRPEGATITRFELSQAGYSDETAGNFQRQLLEKTVQLPGVEAAGVGSNTPLFLDQSRTAVFSRETTDPSPSKRAFGAPYYEISPGYLAATGIPLLEGRDVSFADTAKTPAVAIVNQEFARRLFHTDHAVGRYFRSMPGLTQIVGIVADGKYESLSEQSQPALFFPIGQEGNTATSLIVRSKMDGHTEAAAVAKLVRDLDPAVPIEDSSSWSSQLGLQLLPARAATVALSLFGAFGLLLSITGAFGLASYTVSKRMRELGIRVALGAQARQIVSAALGRMLILLGAGSVLGMLLGVAGSSVLSAIVYQASARDPLVLSAVAMTILLTGSLSVVGPVRRALHADPAHLLREQ